MSFMTDLVDHVRSQRPSMNTEEHLVLDVLAKQLKLNVTDNTEVHLTQRTMVEKIAARGQAIGRHPKWEKGDGTFDSTVRQLREVIRSLRMQYKIPICSDDKGYWIPPTLKQLEAYMVRADKQAAAAARAHLATISILKRRWHHNFSSEFQQLGFSFPEDTEG